MSAGSARAQSGEGSPQSSGGLAASDSREPGDALGGPAFPRGPRKGARFRTEMESDSRELLGVRGMAGQEASLLVVPPA